MGLISWIVVGAIAGLLGRRIVPGPDPGRFIVTVILGMAEDKKAQPDRWPPGRRPASKRWLLAKHGNFAAGVLLADCGGEQALPIFSGEGEAEMFVWLAGAFEDDWRIRETSAEELLSILYGPCVGVGSSANLYFRASVCYGSTCQRRWWPGS